MSTYNIPFLILKRKSPKIIPNLQLLGLFQGTQERVENSRSQRVISVRATKFLLNSKNGKSDGRFKGKPFCLPFSRNFNFDVYVSKIMHL